MKKGTVGVYDKEERLWSAKSKGKITCLRGFDLDADGVPELVSGWENGVIEVFFLFFLWP